MRASLAIAIILSFTPELFAQGGPTEVEDDDSVVTAGFTLSAQASRVHLPIGHEVTFSAITDSTTPLAYSWSAACGGKNPWRTAVDWNVPTIVDCIGVPGKQTYRVTANGKTADAFVEWHKPNEVFLSVGPPLQPVVYNSNGSFRVDQIFTLELCWNQEPIGPCAMVCAQENIQMTSYHATFDVLAARITKAFANDFWWPNCGENTVEGFASFPGLVTWNFKSPRLYDRQAHWGDSQFWANVQMIDAGTVVASKTHTYRFTGNSCSSAPWLEKQSLVFDLVIESRWAAGQGWLKVPVWRRSTP